jgi:hypothetical protein
MLPADCYHCSCGRSELRDFLLSGIDVCGRSFSYLLHKIEHQQQDSKLLFIATGSSVVRAVAETAEPSSSSEDIFGRVSNPSSSASKTAGSARTSGAHWACVGGSHHTWSSASEARALLADFEGMLEASETCSKMAKRLALACSSTSCWLSDFKLRLMADDSLSGERSGRYDLLPPAADGEVNVVLEDDLYSTSGNVLTDGAGRISTDLVYGLPCLGNGQLLRNDRQVDACALPASAPLTMQARLWVEGCLAKGLWQADATIPPRTILVGRQKQLKVNAREGCIAAQSGNSSFEVIQTFESPKKVRLDIYLVSILEACSGEKRVALEDLLLELQRSEAKGLLQMADNGPDATKRNAIKGVLGKYDRRHVAGGELRELDAVGFDVLSEPCAPRFESRCTSCCTLEG